MKLLHFRTASATEVSGYLVRMCSFSLHFGHLEEIIHVRLETNFDSTQIWFYCSPPFRTTLKAIAVLCSLGHCAHCAQHIVLSDWKLWMHRLGRKISPPGEVDMLVPTGVSYLQHQHCGFTTDHRWLLWVPVRACENANGWFHFPNE